MVERSEKTLVIGACGYIGEALFNAYAKDHPGLVGTHYRAGGKHQLLDLQKPDLRPILDDEFYSSAVIAAGIANISQCEKDPVGTKACNVEGTLSLVRQLCNRGLAPILFSTDYVFDGKTGGYDETAPVNPLNAYGKQKVELELRLAEEFPGQYLLIRLSKVYGAVKGDGTLIDEMANAFTSQKKVRAARDQIFCPILIDDVVAGILQLQKARARGVYHLCGDEVVSRLEIAERVRLHLGAFPHQLEAISLGDLGESFSRPRRTDMVNRKIYAAIGLKITALDATIEAITAGYGAWIH